MTDGISKDDLNKMLFSNLVIMLSTTAMQQLGKVTNPMTGKTELDLQGAQATIDMIDMLKAKSEGNLDDEETRLVTQTLSALQMNYVDTASKAPEPAAEDEAAPDAEAAEPDAESDAAPDAEADAGDEEPEKKDPKFHKSYGEE